LGHDSSGKCGAHGGRRRCVERGCAKLGAGADGRCRAHS
jgi:hypothetical protein